MIHLAYNHDFVDMAAAARTDLRAVDVFGAAIVGSAKPFVVTSGTLGLAMEGSCRREASAPKRTCPNPPCPGWRRRVAAITLAGRGAVVGRPSRTIGARRR